MWWKIEFRRQRVVVALVTYQVSFLVYTSSQYLQPQVITGLSRSFKAKP